MSSFLDIKKEYLDYCENFLRRSPCTIKGIDSSLNIFMEYFENREISNYRVEEILDYSEWISCRPGRGGHYSPSAMSQRLCQLKKLFQWADERKHLKVLNWRMIKVPPNNRRRIEFLTEKELHHVIKNVKIRGFESLRLKASLCVLASTGCRVSELLNMRLKDIDLKRGEIFIPHGKGGYMGVVFLSDIAIYYLEQYLKARSETGCRISAVWISTRNGCTKLLPSSLQTQLRQHARTIHFHKKLYPHLFRHTFGTQLLKNGANIREVQELMRHQSLESTMIYTHVTNTDLHKVHKTCIKL